MTVIKQYNTGTSAWEPIVSGVQGPTGPSGSTGPTGPTGAAGSFASAQSMNTPTFTTNNYQLISNDLGKMLLLTNGATAGTVTVGTSLGFIAGQSIDMIVTGTGQITVSAGGATLNATPGYKLRTQYSSATLFCVSTNSFVLIGDLSA
jgi:hypothetical protein